MSEKDTTEDQEILAKTSLCRKTLSSNGTVAVDTPHNAHSDRIEASCDASSHRVEATRTLPGEKTETPQNAYPETASVPHDTLTKTVAVSTENRPGREGHVNDTQSSTDVLFGDTPLEIEASVSAITLLTLAEGDFVASVYNKRWYVAKVLAIDKGEETLYKLSFMQPCRGKWKWGLADEGDFDATDILCSLTPPVSVSKTSKLMDIRTVDRAKVEVFFSQLQPEAIVIMINAESCCYTVANMFVSW